MSNPTEELAKRAIERFRKQAVDAARREYQTDYVEVDDDAIVSTTDGGTWVQARVWVSYEEMAG